MIGKIGVLVLMALSSATLSGCFTSSGCSHDNVTFTWTLVDAANNVFHCEDVNATTVVIKMGDRTTSFSCRDYGGTTASIHTGTYATSFQLQDAAGKVLSQTDSMQVTISGCGTVDLSQVDFEITPPAPVCAIQDVSFTWSIVQDANNAPLTCQTVGAGTVRLNLGTQVFNFDCNVGAGQTTAVQEGTYPTSLQLFDLNSKLLSQTSAMNVTVPHCAGVDLQNVVFGVQ